MHDHRGKEVMDRKSHAERIRPRTKPIAEYNAAREVCERNSDRHMQVYVLEPAYGFLVMAVFWIRPNQ